MPGSKTTTTYGLFKNAHCHVKHDINKQIYAKYHVLQNVNCLICAAVVTH